MVHYIYNYQPSRRKGSVSYTHLDVYKRQKESSRSSVAFKRLTAEDAPMVNVPKWLERDKNALKGTVVTMPAREDIDMPIEEHLIVELYSK